MSDMQIHYVVRRASSVDPVGGEFPITAISGDCRQMPFFRKK
jgi:hypothetical protein